MPIVGKSGSLNLLERFGLVVGLYRIDLPCLLPLITTFLKMAIEGRNMYEEFVIFINCCF